MRLSRFLNRGRADRDHALEFQSHLEIEIEENIARGMSASEARRAAYLKFGNPTTLREEVYQVLSVETLLQDIRYGVRQLRRAPGFTAVAVLTLALGIGANTAIFSVMNAALLRALPVRDPQQLFFLNTTVQFGSQSGDGDTSLTEYIFEQLRAERRVFSDLVAFVPISNQKVAVRYGKEPEEAQVDMVSGNFFSGLGVQPALGRGFSLEDESSHAPLAVLSYAYWSARTGRDASVLGHALEIKGIPFTIVGVAAPEFAGVENKKATDVWIPLQSRAELQPWGQPAGAGLGLYESAHNWWCLKTIGRLQPGIGGKQAAAQLNPIFQRAALEGTTRDPKLQKPQLYFTPARGIDGLRDAYQQPLTILMVMVVLVLAIACANIAMMLIARSAGRRREFSLRMALGGNRVRLFRQLLTESLLLVLIGGTLGWWFAESATGALSVWMQLDLNLTPDRTVLAFTLALSLLAALVFGLAPLSSVLRIPIGLAMKTSAATANRDRRRLRGDQVVVALQISLCLTLLVGAGLLLQTLRNLEAVDVGVRTRGLLVFGISPQNLHSDAEALRFYDGLLDRMRTLPGVQSATVMRHRIGSGWSSNASVLVDGVDPRGDDNSYARWNGVGPDYFYVLGTPVLLGRDFNLADSASAPRVAIVNQTFAERYLPGRDPLGHQVTRGDNRPSTIVGVVQNSKYTGVEEKDMPMAWFPYTQFEGLSGVMHVELRTLGGPERLLPEVRRAMLRFAPELPLLQPMTQQEQFERSFSQGRLLARLAVLFGLLAALLVATGLYGTLAYRVSQRTAEVGIRMALGAQRRQVLWMVLRGSLVVSAVGVAIGLPLSMAGARFLRTMLFGVQPGDPRMFVGGVLGIAMVALAASLIPARKAATVNPIVALRSE
ncbi:MAG TPA: ABC transporter permease [Bryobacteraceae bacterium]|jgi:predicted permease|nr:ABC transporter permease [Bryobacteraceae bacterium]